MLSSNKRSLFLRTVDEILTYVSRDMTSPEGGFYSAEDADSEGEEGKFYVWNKRKSKISWVPTMRTLFLQVYRFEKDGNFLEEATHEKTGTNIPHLRKSLDQHARDNNQRTQGIQKKN